MQPLAMDYAVVAMLGAFGGGSAMAFFLLWLTKLKGEESMTCKAHGECLGCRLDIAEDDALKLVAKFGTLQLVLNDIDPKLNQKHAQMREYVDEQFRKIDARLLAQSQRMDAIFEALKK